MAEAPTEGFGAVMQAQETTLRSLRRSKYGAVKVAAKKLKLSRWTLYRAELGKPVGDSVKRRLAKAFGTDWATLMTSWIVSALEATQ
jgi:hypothetical protein